MRTLCCCCTDSYIGATTKPTLVFGGRGNAARSKQLHFFAESLEATGEERGEGAKLADRETGTEGQALLLHRLGA